MNWKGVGKGLLWAALAGAVWGITREVLNLEERLGSYYDWVDLLILVAIALWFGNALVGSMAGGTSEGKE